MARAPVAPPPALNGLFDELGDAVVDVDLVVTERRPIPASLARVVEAAVQAEAVAAQQAQAPEAAAPAVAEETVLIIEEAVVVDATVLEAVAAADNVHSEGGELFNFTLEPGATVEPEREPSPFDEASLAAPVPTSPREQPRAPVASVGLGLDVAFTLSGELPPAAPPPLASTSTRGFAELQGFDLDAALLGSAATTAAGVDADPLDGLSLELGVEEPRPPATSAVGETDFSMANADVSAPTAEEDFSTLDLIDDVAPGLAALPPPAPQHPEAAARPKVDPPAPGHLPPAPTLPRTATSPATFTPSTQADALPTHLPPAPALPRSTTSPVMATLSTQADSLPTHLPPAPALPRTPTSPPEMGATPSVTPSGKFGKGAKSTKPTLSSRIGQLAEALEAGGRISDAALLYEVQAVLTAAGR